MKKVEEEPIIFENDWLFHVLKLNYFKLSLSSYQI